MAAILSRGRWVDENYARSVKRTFSHVFRALGWLKGLERTFDLDNIYKLKLSISLPWITIFGREWGDSPMVFWSDAVTNEKHLRAASSVTKIIIYGKTYII